MKRYLSRHVVVDGVDRGLSLVATAGGEVVSVKPYTHETAGTSYIDVAIVIYGRKVISPKKLVADIEP